MNCHQFPFGSRKSSKSFRKHKKSPKTLYRSTYYQKLGQQLKMPFLSQTSPCSFEQHHLLNDCVLLIWLSPHNQGTRLNKSHQTTLPSQPHCFTLFLQDLATDSYISCHCVLDSYAQTQNICKSDHKYLNIDKKASHDIRLIIGSNGAKN